MEGPEHPALGLPREELEPTAPDRTGALVLPRFFTWPLLLATSSGECREERGFKIACCARGSAKPSKVGINLFVQIGPSGFTSSPSSYDGLPENIRFAGVISLGKLDIGT